MLNRGQKLRVSKDGMDLGNGSEIEFNQATGGHGLPVGIRLESKCQGEIGNSRVIPMLNYNFLKLGKIVHGRGALAVLDTSVGRGVCYPAEVQK